MSAAKQLIGLSNGQTQVAEDFRGEFINQKKTIIEKSRKRFQNEQPINQFIAGRSLGPLEDRSIDRFRRGSA